MFNLSQIWPLHVAAAVTTAERPVKRTDPALANMPCSMPLVRTDTFTASILRTHSQCQRWTALGHPQPLSVTAELMSSSNWMQESGGACRDRTDDLMLAKQPLSQLS
jgi:hypothetical protein